MAFAKGSGYSWFHPDVDSSNELTRPTTRLLIQPVHMTRLLTQRLYQPLL